LYITVYVKKKGLGFSRRCVQAVKKIDFRQIT
jgi:hypothetical protein